MNIKQVVSSVLMVILSVFLILLVVSISVVTNVKSQSIIKAMEKVDFINNAETNAKCVLENYLPEEKVQEVLKKVSISAEIKEIVSGFDNNTVEKIANEKQQEIKKQIVDILDEDIGDNNKQLFAETVSTAYIKAILPVSEFNTISKINARYNQKLVLAITVIFILCIFILFFLYVGKKTFKWAVIALYNSVIFNSIVLILLNSFNNIRVGNNNTTVVILQILKQIKTGILIGIVITIVIVGIFNYIAYFRKRKHKKHKIG